MVESGGGWPPRRSAGVGVRLHFVRHGQSAWNVAGRVQGQAPGVPLTELGRRQAESAAESLAASVSGSGAVISSDLLRAWQTAAPIAAALGVIPRPERALREQALGSLEGRLAAELTEQPTPPGVPVTAIRWGGGESIADVRRRVGAFLRGLLADPPEATVVLVSHAEAIRVALAWLRGRGAHETAWIDVPHGSVTTIDVPAGRLGSS